MQGPSPVPGSAHGLVSGGGESPGGQVLLEAQPGPAPATSSPVRPAAGRPVSGPEISVQRPWLSPKHSREENCKYDHNCTARLGPAFRSRWLLHVPFGAIRMVTHTLTHICVCVFMSFIYMLAFAFPKAQTVKNLPAMQETWV